MPTTRRKAAGNAGSRTKPKTTQNQAKLTFHGRVTKAGASETPDAKAATIKADKLETPDLQTADVVVEELQTTSADSSLLLDDEPAETVDEPAEAVDELAEAVDEPAEAVEEPVDPDEVLARKVSEARIKSYWEEKEEVMEAPRVHLKGLGLHEKLLRQWDVDNRYGVSSDFAPRNSIC
jgi:DNA polymerase delta subunit 4